ncbi:hypothetical protein, partial [Mucilaginibacter arboris]|uniref:hypothetical protein n=1 Tax=Mucilaginibacter arboris TaxID=2682090 RepID=UPI001E51A532
MYNAPIAFVLLASEVLSDPIQDKKMFGWIRSSLVLRSLDIMQANPDVFLGPYVYLDSSKSWKEWQGRHSSLIKLQNTILESNCDKAQLKKLVGNIIWYK